MSCPSSSLNDTLLPSHQLIALSSALPHSNIPESMVDVQRECEGVDAKHNTNTPNCNTIPYNNNLHIKTYGLCTVTETSQPKSEGYFGAARNNSPISHALNNSNNVATKLTNTPSYHNPNSYSDGVQVKKEAEGYLPNDNRRVEVQGYCPT
eukprot:CAMPEP_0174267758 /NCGR_PEP_ID=MMETSP0439-20130205/34836_1 /TAXON_ID=0 /ORGANISM="Stereomyxa ramosa, Strain Chinc5" /LENGTH=150 /DNA_ID=CAMNT_0015355457 /DNA_START=209 /DNA_END=657 /DNA_ORIENTATION=-